MSTTISDIVVGILCATFLISAVFFATRADLFASRSEVGQNEYAKISTWIDEGLVGIDEVKEYYSDGSIGWREYHTLKNHSENKSREQVKALFEMKIQNRTSHSPHKKS